MISHNDTMKALVNIGLTKENPSKIWDFFAKNIHFFFISGDFCLFGLKNPKEAEHFL